MNETPSKLDDPLNASFGSPVIEPVNKVALFTGGLFLLGLLALCYVAAQIILPICVALLLNLVFRPVIRPMHRMNIPRSLAALLIIMILISGGVALGAALSGPATEWGEKIPNALPDLRTKLQILIQPVTNIQKTVSRAENVTSGQDPKTLSVTVKGNALSDKLFSSTRVFVSGIFEMLLVLFFLLISGDTFLQRFIEILPRIQDKKKALQISHQIERDISAYLRTITLMNLLVGIATAIITAVCGVGDPILWGAIAFLLNYIPILGPLLGVCIFALAGMLTHESVGGALLPAGLYFAIHLIEGQVVTPFILSKRFILNPALVILSLIFWFWLWGVAGAILATPMLAILKIICDRTTRLKPFGHLIEG